VYLSATLTILSIIIAGLLLQSNSYRLLYYGLLTAAITAVVFELKTHFAGWNTSFQSAQESLKPVVVLFLLLFAVLIVPLALAYFLPAEVWVILIVSFTTGLSLSEVVFYFSRR
jgi:hypothetical protein